MKELLELSFTPANLLATICLMLVVVYWLVFLVGLLDLSFLDIHIGHDHDIDVDHDVSANKDVGKHYEVGSHQEGVGSKVMGFFNLGYVPVMVIFSFFALFYWAISILGNYYLADGLWILNVAVALGGIVGALFLAKIFTHPMRQLFKKFNDEEAPIDLRGKICTIELGPEGTRIGQATLQMRNKNLSIHVRSETGKRIPPGVKCVILEKNEEDESYTVEPLESETQNPP
jgi:hypothetical protein